MRTIRELIDGREPYSVESGWSIKKVVEYLCEKGVGAAAVREGDKAVGVFSERDLMKRVVLGEVDPEKTTVDEVMSRGIISVSPDEDFRVAKAQMLEKRIRHLVVMDSDGTLRGLVSMRELVEVDLTECRDLVNRLNDEYYRSALKTD